jgi:ribosomal protein L7/L12
MHPERRWESLAWALAYLLVAVIAFAVAVRPGNALLAGVLFFAGIGALVYSLRQAMEFLQPGVLVERDRAAWLRRTAELQEPGSYAVGLEFIGARRIEVIKVIREATGCDLVTAKHIVESPEEPVCTGRSRSSCELIVARLAQAGATATIHHGGGVTD